MSHENYVYSHSTADRLAGKYLYIPALLGWIVAFFYEIHYGKIDFFSFQSVIHNSLSIMLLLPIIVVLLCFLYLALYKQAHRVEFNKQNGTITISLYRNKKEIVYRFNQLLRIKIDWFSIFKFEDDTTVWLKHDKNFVEFLKSENINREWGRFGKCFMKEEYLTDTNTSQREKDL